MRPTTEGYLPESENWASRTPSDPAGLDLRRSAAVTTPWLLSGCPHDGAPIQQIALHARVSTVGRHTDNTLCIANPTVSNHHAELHRAATSLLVADLNSTNGTFVNGSRVEGDTELHDGDVLQFGTAVYKVRSCAGAATNATVSADAANIAVGHVLFDKLLSDPAVVPHFQPIVRLEDAECVAYEVLARSRLMGLRTPIDMFRVASERNMEPSLSELLRTEGVRVGRQLNSTLYLNTHPVEVGRPELLESLETLRCDFPDTPLTLEIHEAAITSSNSLALLRRQLADLNIGLAYDDFGAGQARLRELAEAPPDVIKFDICFIRGLPDASAEHRRLLRSLVEAVRGLGVTSLAEGVETEGEADVCLEIGFQLAQGFLFGRPNAIEPQRDVESSIDYVSWAIDQASP
ncbi:MAG: EAL domain-containing protein [Pirellulaceae bacterium]